MMKFKTTKKEVLANYSNVICVGYCRLQRLLYHEEPIACIVGPEGLRADVYHVCGDTAIVTGPVPFGNIYPDIDITRGYEKRAVAIINDDRYMFSLKDVLNALILEFVEEVLDNE